jgi:hypothetical protein
MPVKTTHLDYNGNVAGECAAVQAQTYELLNHNGVAYLSESKGTIGGHRGMKIYGRLDCPSALRAIAKGQYVKHRVFFANTNTAIAAGYRPCAVCMSAMYLIWKNDRTTWMSLVRAVQREFSAPKAAVVDEKVGKSDTPAQSTGRPHPPWFQKKPKR